MTYRKNYCEEKGISTSNLNEAQRTLHYIAENMKMAKSISEDGYNHFQMAIKALEQEPCGDVTTFKDDVLDAIGRIGLQKSGTKEVQAVAECLRAVEALPPVNPQESFKPMVEIDLYSVIKQKYIEREVLDKIRAEIEHVIDYTYDSTDYKKALYNGAYKDGLYEALDIIDKYKAESEKE